MTLIPNEGSTPTALIVDGDRVYWLDVATASLNSIGVDGQNRREEISHEVLQSAIAFDLYKVNSLLS